MGEVDTKPIEPVQVALSLFGEKGEQRKYRSSSDDPSQSDSDKEELQSLYKELANYKVQLEARESAYMQALLSLQQYNERVDELSSQLMKSELDRDHYERESIKASTRANELESKIKEMSDPVAETTKIHEQLLHVLNELKFAQVELLGLETELTVEKDDKLKALTRGKELEADVEAEKAKVNVLLKRVEELDEAILMLKQANAEAEQEKCQILVQKDSDIDVAMAEAAEMQEQLHDLRNQLGMVQELENQLSAKNLFIESLQSDLCQANLLISSSEEATSDAAAELEELKMGLEVKRRENSDQAAYIEVLRMELNQLKQELKSANEKVSHMSSDLDTLTEDLQNMGAELSEMKERETEAQVELAWLKSELHKARSKIIAAEAAEARADSVRSGPYLTVQQLAIEAGEAKKECWRLKQEVDKAPEDTENTILVEDTTTLDEEVFEDASNGIEEDGFIDKSKPHITISLEEYESLLSVAKKVDEMSISSLVESSVHQHNASGIRQETEILRKELEIATVRIGEFRTRAEQAVSRAEAAEKAKAAIDDRLRRSREQKQRRRAALTALHEESVSRDYVPPTPYGRSTPSAHTPLGKVLNMKF